MIGWRALCAGLVFVAVTTVTAAAFGSLAGRMTPQVVWVSFALGAASAIACARGASAPKQKITAADGVLFAVFALASLRAFLWVLYPHGAEWKVLSPHNLGDMALHLNLIERWANGGHFWPENPFLSGAAFAYHPGMDLFSALLRIAGIPLVEGLRWVGLLGALAAAAALWRWGRGFALAGFLFAGGFGLLAYGASADASLAWKNLFLTMFVTQRGLLFSLPAGLVLMTVWRAQLDGDERGPKLPVLAQVALYASMPLFNAPAFLFLSALLAACALAAWRAGNAKPFFAAGAASVIPAAWLVRLVTAKFGAPSALRFEPGWMQGDGGVLFWAVNFGVFLPLIVWLGVTIFRRSGNGRADVPYYAIAAGTLVFCFLFLIAPWAWDNTKLMLWGYLALLPLLWRHLVGRWPEWAQALACVTLFASGAIDLVAGLNAEHGYKLADRAELGEVQVMLRSLGPDTRVACAPSYEHPAMLLGQPVVMGYEGHLFSQGLDYGKVRSELDVLMEGGDGWKNAARHLGARAIYWGARERALWPDSKQPWNRAPGVDAPHGTLYILTPLLLED